MTGEAGGSHPVSLRILVVDLGIPTPTMARFPGTNPMIFAHLPIDPARLPVCTKTDARAASIDWREQERETPLALRRARA